MEARWLFDLPASKIDVVVHPQSIIHSMVEFVDGSVKAQMGIPTMLVPIQYALTYPERQPLDQPRMDLVALGSLTFEQPDRERFPCLQLAYDALEAGGSAGCVLNAANEVAVYAFLEGRIRFTAIPEVIQHTLHKMEHVADPSLSVIVDIDQEARSVATEHLSHV
jgi:1-deoxy-D-xylulose-5-phosphate reductoisomerase